MKESAIMGWSNQPDGAAALPVLAMLDARCPFLRMSPCADKASDSQHGFCGAKYAPRVLAKKTLEFYRGVFAPGVGAAGYAF